jgi:hypothetical protein
MDNRTEVLERKLAYLMKINDFNAGLTSARVRDFNLKVQRSNKSSALDAECRRLYEIETRLSFQLKATNRRNKELSADLMWFKIFGPLYYPVAAYRALRRKHRRQAKQFGVKGTGPKGARS